MPEDRRPQLHRGINLKSPTYHPEIGSSWFPWIRTGSYRAVPRRAHDRVVPNHHRLTLCTLRYWRHCEGDRTLVIAKWMFVSEYYVRHRVPEGKRWQCLTIYSPFFQTSLSEEIFTTYCSISDSTKHIIIFRNISWTWKNPRLETIYLYLVPRIKISGSVPPLPVLHHGVHWDSTLDVIGKKKKFLTLCGVNSVVKGITQIIWNDRSQLFGCVM